jgi:hypothetical protein
MADDPRPGEPETARGRRGAIIIGTPVRVELVIYEPLLAKTDRAAGVFGVCGSTFVALAGANGVRPRRAGKTARRWRMGDRRGLADMFPTDRRARRGKLELCG